MFWIRINHRSTPSPIRPLVTRRTCGAGGSDDPPRHPRIRALLPLSIPFQLVVSVSMIRRGWMAAGVPRPFEKILPLGSTACLLGVCGSSSTVPSPWSGLWDTSASGVPWMLPGLFSSWHRLSQGRPCLRRWNQHLPRLQVLPPTSFPDWVWQRPRGVGKKTGSKGRETPPPPPNKKTKKREEKREADAFSTWNTADASQHERHEHAHVGSGSHRHAVLDRRRRRRNKRWNERDRRSATEA